MEIMREITNDIVKNAYKKLIGINTAVTMTSPTCSQLLVLRTMLVKQTTSRKKSKQETHIPIGYYKIGALNVAACKEETHHRTFLTINLVIYFRFFCIICVRPQTPP